MTETIRRRVNIYRGNFKKGYVNITCIKTQDVPIKVPFGWVILEFLRILQVSVLAHVQ